MIRLDILIFFVFMSTTLLAQNVGIGTSSPDASAKLDIVDNQRGLLIPRMTTAERNSITNPAHSLLIFNTTVNCFQAYNANGSIWEDIHCFCTPVATVAQAATAVTSSSFAANWSAVSGASTYYLDVSTDPMFGSFLPGYNNLNVGNVTSYNVVGLNCATTYYYRVRTQTCAISSNSNTITVTTTGSAPAPNALAATMVSMTSFRANWSAVAGATTYYLDIATDPSFTSFVPGYNNLNVGNVTFRVVTGLNCGTTYYYRVRAQTCAISGNSNTITVSTNPLTAPNAFAINVSSYDAEINWSNPTDYMMVEVEISYDASFTLLYGTYSQAFPTIYISPLGCNTTFYYRARGTNACGTSAFGPTGSFTTDPTPCVKLSGPNNDNNQR